MNKPRPKTLRAAVVGGGALLMLAGTMTPASAVAFPECDRWPQHRLCTDQEYDVILPDDEVRPLPPVRINPPVSPPVSPPRVRPTPPESLPDPYVCQWWRHQCIRQHLR